MRPHRLVLGLALAGSVALGGPGPAGAQGVCFQDQFGTAYNLEVLSVTGSDVSLLGEATLGLLESAPLTGSAVLLASLDATFELAVHSAGALRVPFTVSGTVQAPDYTTGAGTAVNTAAVTTPLTFSPCTAGFPLKPAAVQP